MKRSSRRIPRDGKDGKDGIELKNLKKTAKEKDTAIKLLTTSSDSDSPTPCQLSTFQLILNFLTFRCFQNKETLEDEPIGFFELFRYMKPMQLFCLIAGFILAAVSGFFHCSYGYLNGKLTTMFVDPNTTDLEFYEDAMPYAIFRMTQSLEHLFPTSVLRQESEWHDRHSAGTLKTKFNENMGIIKSKLPQISLLFYNFSVYASGVGVSFHVSWKLALLSMLSLPIIMCARAILANKNKTYEEKKEKISEKAAEVVSEALNSVRTVQAFNGQEEIIEKYGNAFEKSATYSIKQALWDDVVWSNCDLMLLTIFGVAINFGATLYCNKEILEVGMIFTVLFVCLTSSAIAGTSAQIFNDVLNARVAARQIYRVIERVPKIDAMSAEGQKLLNVSGRVEFRNVHFRYSTRRDAKILDGFNLCVEPGTSVALVGHSGSGKSTAFKLLTRLYEQEDGQIFIDGHDIKSLNIGWLRKKLEIQRLEEMIQAAQMANAHDFIMKLSEGYNTIIGDGGIQLSGGQKQRVAIARTLIRNPKILLLDEATSALDAHSENLVQDALNNARKGRTTIMIAHRLSTIRGADKIVYVEDGKVAEYGTHEELISLGLRYAMMVDAQKFDDDQERVEVDNEDEHSLQGSIQDSDGDSELPSTSGQQASLPHITPTQKDSSTTYGLLDVFGNSSGNYKYMLLATIFAILRSLEQLFWSLLLNWVYDAFKKPPAEMKDELWKSILLFPARQLYKMITNVLVSYLASKTSENIIRRLRIQCLRSLLNQDGEFYHEPENTPAKMEKALSTYVKDIKPMVDANVYNAISTVFSIMFNLGLAISYCWQVGAVGAGVIMVSGFLIRLLTKKLAEIDKRKKKEEKSPKIVAEMIENSRTIQLLTCSQRLLDSYKEAQAAEAAIGLESIFYKAINDGFGKSHSYFSIFACYFAGMIFVKNGLVIRDDAYRAIQPLYMSAYGVVTFINLIPKFSEGTSATDLIFKLIYRKPATDDIMDGLKPEIQGNISLKSVKLTYSRRPDHPVLTNLTFSARSGQTIALVGPSGAGKSTCISILERFYDVCEGAIEIDGQDIRSLSLYCLRTQMALVGQEPTLFSGTIKENVCFGLNDIPIEKVMEALELANALNFVTNLPAGLHTEVGEKGSMLSGGQKQRIAIARALVRNPKILLLDEATSALDSQAEKAVQEALDRARQGRTCITIAHRLSSIQNSDVIVYIDHGMVLESAPDTCLQSYSTSRTCARIQKILSRIDFPAHFGKSTTFGTSFKHHPLDVLRSSGQLNLCCPRAVRGNLFDFIKTKDLLDKIKLTVEDVLDGVSQGLAELHHCQTTLGNLKTSNILLSRGNRNTKAVVPDLGHSVKQPSQISEPYDKDFEMFAKVVQFCLMDAEKTAQNRDEYIKTVVKVIPARFINRHPYFWSDDLKLDYIQAVSEKFKKLNFFKDPERILIEMDSKHVIRADFHAKMCPAITPVAATCYRKDVVRFIRKLEGALVVATTNACNKSVSVAMAIVSSENRTCADEKLLALYQSWSYIASIVFNCLVPTISTYFLGRAIFQLCNQATIQYSTRILLIATILFAACHQFSYFAFKIDLLHTMFFKLDQPCFLQRSSHDCRFISIAQTTGVVGMALTGLAMSTDRALALTFPADYHKLKSVPGVVLSVFVFIVSFSTWFLLTMNDPLTGYLNHCGFYPSYSVANFQLMLDVILYLAIFNLIWDVILFYYARQQILWRRSYQFQKRYEARISLNCTRAVFVISICQCISNGANSGLMRLLMMIGTSITSVTYSSLLSLFYTAPYSCILLPILMIRVLEYIREQRTIGILSLRSEKPGLEEHHQRMRAAWS
ncbi:hypothetical protein L5515_013439 [Caenorhabditis briggsae]|uniref:Uncharacterized protein n=1 Tax=Caenorhabditis briggsae TaxID=6238 RepID=A0AAE9E891_CAEBR|nr:hypothetical protein L5515_013439 [Caenorhabditis briggsae]